MEILPGPDRFESLMGRLSRFFEKLGGFAHDHKYIVIAFSILFLGISLFLATRTRFDTSYESYFNRGDTSYAEYLRFRKDFGSDEMSYIVYNAPGKAHGAWDLDVMTRIALLTDALNKEVPFIKKVTSLANAEFIEGKEDELLIHDLMDPFPQNQDELLALRDKVMKKPLFVGTLVSGDGKHGAILIEMEKGVMDNEEELILDPSKGAVLDNLYPQATHDAIERILAFPAYKGICFHHTGDVPLNAVYNRITRGESIRMGLISLGLIGGLLLYFFRRPFGVIGPLVTVCLAVLVSIGFVGMMGWKLDLVFTMLPGTIMTVGVASAVHILNEYATSLKQLKDKRAAIRKTMLMLGAPCLFTMITDVAGFGSTNVSSIKSLMHFAYYSTVGVIAAFLLTVTLFLSLMVMFGKSSSAREWRMNEPDTPAADEKPRRKPFPVRFFAALARFDIRYPWPITIVWMTFFILTGFGMTFLTVDSNFLTEFSDKIPIRKATEYVDQVMIGAGGFNYLFDSGEPEGIYDPKFLKRVESIQHRVDTEKHMVMKTMSIVDLLKDINQTFHGEDPAYYVLPDSRELIAQYLLIYEMSGGEELENYITSDRQRANLQVHCKLLPSSAYEKTMGNVKHFIETHYKPSERPTLTGSGFLFVRLINYIVRSQILGFGIAFIVISIMMCMVQGSLRIGMLAMIPNIAPVLVTLGIMGWTGINLDYVKLLVASIAIGIAVDDTIHFVLRYRLEFWRTGNYHLALEASLNDVGRSVFITTLVLLGGFAVNMLSVMNSIAEFGFLTFITLSVAALADYFLTPALIIVTRAFGPETNANRATE